MNLITHTHGLTHERVRSRKYSSRIKEEEEDHEEENFRYGVMMMAMTSLFFFKFQIVQDCDDEARRMEKCEEMLILSQQIEFPKDIRRIPIITGSRFLVKSGQVTQLVNRDENKLTFGKKFSKIKNHFFGDYYEENWNFFWK